jgi:hypothetical protein
MLPDSLKGFLNPSQVSEERLVHQIIGITLLLDDNFFLGSCS